MVTLEDKLLGEKLEYYCSSSESENEDENNFKGENAKCSKEFASLSKDVTHWSGISQNTGPKGVVQDWQLYKQLEAEKREVNEKRKLELMTKLSVTTTTVKQDEEGRKDEDVEAELVDLMSEEFLQMFQKKRIAEILNTYGRQKVFGKVFSLNSPQDFLDAVEKEDKNTTVIIHIYEKYMSACTTLNECLNVLAIKYKNVRFCKTISSIAGTSYNFKLNGLPALLVYKSGQLIGNFVRITDKLSDDFFPSDLESFLVENGMIISKNLCE